MRSRDKTGKPFKKKSFFSSRNKNRDKNYKICPICMKPIHTISTAIMHKDSGKLAHFDCLIKELKKEYHLNPDEDIYYIGAGRFGIVEKLKKSKGSHLVIKRKINNDDYLNEAINKLANSLTAGLMK